MTNTDPQKSMIKKSIIQTVVIPVVALAILLLMVAWLAGAFDNKVVPGLTPASTLAPADVSDIYTVTSHKQAIYEPVSASVAAKQATLISSRILARIDTIEVRAGNSVKKGDVLIRLEQHDLQSQVLQKTQNVNAVNARHNEAKQNYERAVQLFKKQLISEFELDKNRADYQSISADLTAAEQGLSQAKTSLSYATLRAPIDGKIVDRFAEPGDTAQPGSKLLSLYNPLSLRVEAQVREKLALTLTSGQPIDIELPTSNKTIQGEVEEIVPAANTGSRSFLVKVRINYTENLLPGMYARILVPAGEQSSIDIPENLVAHVGQLAFVWLMIDGEIQRRFIRLGTKPETGMITVISGLNIGDQVMQGKPR